MSGHVRISRRSMMQRSTLALSSMAFGSVLGHAAPGAAPARGFRIGACDWSLEKGGDLGAFAVAKELGLDGVQVSLGSADNDMQLRRPEIQQAYLAEAERQGVAIASLAIGELNNIPYKSDPRAEEWVRDSIDVCKALKVQVVLLAFFGNGDLRDDAAGVDVVVERLKKVAPKAQEAGVYLAIESWLSGPQHVEIIDRVGSPNVKVYYDLGNSHLRGYDIYQEIRDLGSGLICEFHAKDYDSLFGQGKVDFVRAREAMDAIGYSGWIQIEGAKPLGMMDSYKADLKYLKEVFPPKV
ncbi:MAG: sugar phosphate isomerase/epimerase [Candidatus Hydrogenedentes bacterium]|nr:sugar phosphate isomerase/epimerase [Candidatus Hydrogenedentota bacterium]